MPEWRVYNKCVLSRQELQRKWELRWKMIASQERGNIRSFNCIGNWPRYFYIYLFRLITKKNYAIFLGACCNKSCKSKPTTDLEFPLPIPIRINKHHLPPWTYLHLPWSKQVNERALAHRQPRFCSWWVFGECGSATSYHGWSAGWL